jgi:hypothetical protein
VQCVTHSASCLSKMKYFPVGFFLLLIFYVFYTSCMRALCHIQPNTSGFYLPNKLDQWQTHTTKFFDLYAFGQFTELIVPVCGNNGYLC